MTEQTLDPLQALSRSLGNRASAAAPLVATIATPSSRSRAGILWRPDVVVTSEQSLPKAEAYVVSVASQREIPAKPAGRDPTTNVALLRLEHSVEGVPTPTAATPPRMGEIALSFGVSQGQTRVRLAVLGAVGPAWDSLAGGRIDALLTLDCRFRAGEDGGPVVDAAGGLLGMATAGPRGRALIIPHATIARVLDPLLAEGRILRGWLGLGLQPVAVPPALCDAAGQDSGLIVLSLAESGPAATAGVLPGDILLGLGGHPIRHPRTVAAALARHRLGEPAELRLMRAGAVRTVSVTITARPTG